MYFRYFVIIYPWEKGATLLLNKYAFPRNTPKDALCQLWLKFAKWFLRTQCKYETLTDRRTDDGQQAIKKKKTLKVSAQVS